MERPETWLTREQRGMLREQVRAWARETMKKSSHTRVYVEDKLCQPPGWLNNRLARGTSVAFLPHQLREFAAVLGVDVPVDVLTAAERARKNPRPGSNPLARLDCLDVGLLTAADTAAAEMTLILEAAAQGRKQSARDLAWVRRRFGLGAGVSETLEEIGSEAGLTRERIRQVEAKVLGLATQLVVGIKLPRLTRVHERVLASGGLPYEAVERDLRPQLGDVSLREAIRFLEEVQPPDQLVEVDRASIYGVGKTLPVVAVNPGDTRFTEQASTAARKIFSFAGAALIHDIRALLESTRKLPVALADLDRTLSSLPHLQWLDDSHRWCWFDTPELSFFLRRVATILTVARAPVDMETLYAGLVREARRDFSSQASDVSDPLPPAHVVHAILLRHPRFRRSSANSFTYEGAFGLDELDPSIRVIIDRMEALGCVATRSELYELENHPTHPIHRNSFAFYLYTAGVFERIGPGAWAIRGRTLDDERRRAVLANTPELQRPRSRQWSAVVRLSDAARKNRSISFVTTSFPSGVAGQYRLPCGHVATLHQDRHSTRLVRVGEAVKRFVDDPAVSALRFEFDADTFDLVVRPVDCP